MLRSIRGGDLERDLARGAASGPGVWPAAGPRIWVCASANELASTTVNPNVSGPLQCGQAINVAIVGIGVPAQARRNGKGT